MLYLMMLLTIILNLVRMYLCQISGPRRDEGGEKKTHELKDLTKNDKKVIANRWVEILDSRISQMVVF